MQISPEMEEAIRILRSDKRIEAYNEMTKSHQALVARLDKKDADDATWRTEWQEKHAPSAGSTPPNSDPSVGNPGSGASGQGSTGEGTPRPPEVTPPKQDDKPKRQSRWWGTTDDE